MTYLLSDSGADVFVWSAGLSELARAALDGDGVRVRARVVIGGERGGDEMDYESLIASVETAGTGRTLPGVMSRC